MSRMIWCGQQLELLSDETLQIAHRDVRWARAEVAIRYSEEKASEAYDADLAELVDVLQVRRLPVLELPDGPNPFADLIHIEGDA